MNGEELKIFDCAKLPEAGGTPGEIMGSCDEGMAVATNGGQILIKRVRPASEGKVSANDYFKSSGLSKGSILGQ